MGERDSSAELLGRALAMGLDFKHQPEIYRARMRPEDARNLLVTDLPDHPTPLPHILDEFASTVLPLCKNEASPRFLGFGDTGDDIGALAGGILSLFTQQNLINQSFDSPSATFIEITVLRWLRELLGFANPPVRDVSTVWDVGGVVTQGGTMSNTLAMMLAREHKVPETMTRGVVDPSQFAIVVPRGIGHYSMKGALTWIGVGSHLIEVETDGYRYDLRALKDALDQHAGRIMSVVAYAGDSRTHTIEHLRAVHDLVRAFDEHIWLHADACWGLLCAFSDSLRDKIDGIEMFDSVTVDPHKVMAVPYALSALLVRRPESLRAISSYSDLIMQEDFAFGQVTPCIGSKPWLSLKLWMLMRTRGRSGLAAMADRRVATALKFADFLDATPGLLRLNDPDLLSVMFVYVPSDVDTARPDVERINTANKWIQERMLEDGTWHLHQFSVPDCEAALKQGATLFPLRFMASNPRIEEEHIKGVIEEVLSLGKQYEELPR